MKVDWNVLIGEAVTQLIRIFVPVAVVLCFRWVVQIWKQIKEKHPEIAELIAYAARVGYAAAEEEYRNYPAAAGGDKMAFALYRAEDYLKACGVKVNDDVLRDAIHEYGIDNYKFSWTKPNIADVLADIRKAEDSSADLVLLDGGTGDGTVFDWQLLHRIRRPYFLAGGLNPENVADAVKNLHPFAVDVSSGIETEGKKDYDKMKAFLNAVRKEEVK